MKPIALLSCVMIAASLPLIAAESPSPAPGTAAAPTNRPLDLTALPVNQWIERPVSGWKGKTYYGSELTHGLTAVGGLGVVALSTPAGGARKPDTGEPAGTARVLRFDPSSGAWSVHASSAVDTPFKDKFNSPVCEHLHGIQLCLDTHRQVLVGLTATDLDGRGRLIEFDLATRTAAGHHPDPFPPIVTASSLAYDPVNREVVLATGGFSPVGGSEGTWLYNSEKKQWHRLETPPEMSGVAIPLEEARDQLITLRWLIWKNIEFRATGRETLLDTRSQSGSLATDTAARMTELARLATLANQNAGRATRPYHRSCLESAGKRLTGAAARLTGLDARIKAADPADMEALYRANILPALTELEEAVSDLATTPEPRMSARLVFDSKNQVIICFGGDGQDRGWGDTWVYHCEGRWWERRHPAIHPPAGEARAVAFDSAAGRIILMQASRWGGKNERLWTYDAAANQWQCLEIPRPGDAFWLEYDTAAGCLVAMNQDLNKAWVLRLDAGSAKLMEVRPSPEVRLNSTEGDFVLRDVSSVSDLENWKTKTDEWNRSVPPNTWVKTPTNGTGRPNSGRTWSSIVFDPERRQIYYRDGGHGSYHGSDTDHYDMPTGRWFRSDRRFLPPWPMGSYFGWGRSFSYAPWAVHTYKYGLFLNPLRQRLQRSIGQSGRMEDAPPGAVLEYDPDTGRWSRDFQALGAGAGGAFGGGVTVPGVATAILSIDNFTRYGVKDGEATRITAEGSQQWKNLGTLPRTYDDHCFSWFFDAKRQRAMYYGGPKDKHQLFALDIAAEAPKWQTIELKAPGDGKLPLATREVVYIPKHDRFLMIEGVAGYDYKGPPVIWALDIASGQFQRVPLAAAAGAPKHGGVSMGLQYDPVTDLCFYIAADNSAPTLYAFRYVPEDGPAR